MPDKVSITKMRPPEIRVVHRRLKELYPLSLRDIVSPPLAKSIEISVPILEPRLDFGQRNIEKGREKECREIASIPRHRKIVKERQHAFRLRRGEEPCLLVFSAWYSLRTKNPLYGIPIGMASNKHAHRAPVHPILWVWTLHPEFAFVEFSRKIGRHVDLSTTEASFGADSSNSTGSSSP